MENKEKKSIFKKFLIIYIVILTILMIAFLIYVVDSLIQYENNQIENYIANTIEKLKKESKKGKIEEYIDVSNLKISDFENKKTTVSEGFYELLQNKNINHKPNKENKEENPIYDIYADDNLILEIKLKVDKKENRLGLLNFNKWQIEKIQEKTENGLYTCNITVPNNYKIYVNDKELSENEVKEKVQEEGLAQISKYVEIPYLIKYEISGLLKQPEVKILDENSKALQFEFKGNTVSKELKTNKIENKDEALKQIKNSPDIMKIAEDWSLYLTDDLAGRLHGFYEINKYLIKDSDIYKFAYNWATGVDITFVSSHTLDNPTFTDEKLSNFEIYNENAFSCEVYLQKNLKLRSGKKIEDKMHEKMYFAYYDDTEDNKDNPTWKLVNMQSIVDKN